MMKLLHISVLSIFSAIAFASSAAVAAPDVYVPHRLYVCGTLYHEASDSALAGQEGHPGNPVEAWYFDDVCIVSRTTPMGRAPLSQWPRLVYAYWDDESAPDGDFRFQQWVSPGANPISIKNDQFLPREAQEVNPFWHIITYRDRRGQAAVETIAQEHSSSTGTLVRIHESPEKQSDAKVSYDMDFLLQDDRILSRTYVMHTKHSDHKEQGASGSEILEQTFASEFDDKLPALPTVIKTRMGTLPGRLYPDRMFVVSQMENIPAANSSQDVLSRLTRGLQRMHKVHTETTGIRFGQVTLDNLVDGSRERLSDLMDDKFLLVYAWASWAPEDLWQSGMLAEDQKKYGLIPRLKALHEKYSNSKDVEVIGVSIDVHPDAAREFARENDMPWQNFLLPKESRRMALALFCNGDLPNIMLLRGDGRPGIEHGIETILGYRLDDTRGQTLVDRLVEEKQAAQKAGGYARHWVGEEVLSVLEQHDTVEVLELTGHHMAELMVGAMAPPPPPPPPAPGQMLFAPKKPERQPELDTSDFPTSVGVLATKYPILRKGKVNDRTAADEIMKLLTDDDMISRPGGEEAYPSPRKAIVIRNGKDTVSLVYDGMLEVYLNDDRHSWLILSKEGAQRFEQLYHQMATAAGFELDEKKL